MNEGNDGLRTVALTVLSADNRVNFSRVGKLIALGLYDKADRLWDASTGGELKTLKGHNQGLIGSMSFSPDGTRIASESWDRTIRLWDAALKRQQIPTRDVSADVTSADTRSEVYRVVLHLVEQRVDRIPRPAVLSPVISGPASQLPRRASNPARAE